MLSCQFFHQFLGDAPDYQDSANQNEKQKNISNEKKCDFDGKAVYHDVWATVLFLLNFIAFIALSAIGINHLINAPTTANTNIGGTITFELTDSARRILLATFAVFAVLASFISGLYVLLMRK